MKTPLCQQRRFTSGVVNAIYNGHDSVLVILKNGYTSATGTQTIPSSPSQPASKPITLDIEKALQGVGVKWVKTVTSYHVSDMAKALDDAMTTSQGGLKVIIADGECQLERQRRIRPIAAKRLKDGKRVVRTRFGIDDNMCTGDHSCIRMSGCPSLTIKPNPSTLRTDPVATINQGCVGCGLFGENRACRRTVSVLLQGGNCSKRILVGAYGVPHSRVRHRASGGTAEWCRDGDGPPVRFV